jgi:hypothetical protein
MRYFASEAAHRSVVLRHHAKADTHPRRAKFRSLQSPTAMHSAHSRRRMWRDAAATVLRRCSMTQIVKGFPTRLARSRNPGTEKHGRRMKKRKWSRRESNPLPPACHAGALPNELRPLFATRNLVIRKIRATGRDGSNFVSCFVGRPHHSTTPSGLRHTRSRSAISEGSHDRCGEAAAKNGSIGGGREVLAPWDVEADFCLFGQVVEWSYGCFDDRSGSEKLRPP